MRVKKFGKLHMLTFPLVLMTNVYIYEEKDSLILIDTSLNICANKLIRYINNLAKPLESILLTHAHDDHMGGIMKLHDAFPTAELCIGANEESLFIHQCKKKWDKILPCRKIQTAGTIGSITILETPGHTDGSISFLSKEDNILICGDFMHSQGGLTISGDTRPFFPFPDTATKNLTESIASAYKIKQYDIDKMFCGHGNVTENFSSKLEEIITRAEKRIK